MISYKRMKKISNKKKYIKKYNKENYKTYLLRVKKSDTDVIEKLENTYRRNHYINNLIKEDLYRSILTLKEIKNRLRPVVQQYHIDELYIFGSYSRGEATRDSDVDIYCSWGDFRNRPWYPVGDLIEVFEEALGKEVDVVIIGASMHPFFKEQLDTDKIRLF